MIDRDAPVAQTALGGQDDAMRVSFTGHDTEQIQLLAKHVGLDVVEVEAEPEVIITYGGDGTLIGTETNYPGIPKLPMRDRKSCAKCPIHEDEAVLRRLSEGALEKSALKKLSATTQGKTILGVNDILLRNSDLRSAVRFQVYINDEPATDEMIGDGMVVATPFGSSAYFRSITHTTFRGGIGLAFSNCTEFLNHMVLLPDDVVSINIIRGPAHLTADNTPKVLEVASGDTIVVKRADEEAVILGLDGLRCPLCQYVRAPRRRF